MTKVEHEMKVRINDKKFIEPRLFCYVTMSGIEGNIICKLLLAIALDSTVSYRVL